MPKNDSVRRKILELLRTPTKVTDLKKAMPEVLSFGTINYWLRKLEKERIIKKKKFKDEQGRPTVYALRDISFNKDKKQLLEEYDKVRRIGWTKFLRKIDSHPGILHNEISKTAEENDSYMDAPTDALNEGLYEMRYYLTEKGKKFIEGNKTK